MHKMSFLFDKRVLARDSNIFMHQKFMRKIGFLAINSRCFARAFLLVYSFMVYVRICWLFLDVLATICMMISIFGGT